MMRQILEMMEDKKKEHTATLKYLQDRNNARVSAILQDDQDVDNWDTSDNDEEERRSVRLASKTKLDYNRMHRRGFP